MKVVYNTKGFGLRLTQTEMRLFCVLLGYTLCTHPKSGATSDNTWFSGVDWEEFRAEPLLVRLVEEGMLSNKDLAIREWDEDDPDYEGGWTMETDYRTYELVYVHMTDPWELPGYYDDEETETTTEGESK